MTMTVTARDTLREFADLVIDSIVAGEPDRIPVAPAYQATENGKPSALTLMAAWNTITAVPDARRYLIDEAAGQIFYYCVVEEDGRGTIFAMRLRVESGVLTEYESYFSRSRGDSGWHFELDGIRNLPPVWGAVPAGAKRASRDELVALANVSCGLLMDAPPPSADCRIIDTGFTVRDGTVWPLDVMPVDPDVRILVDEEEGVALSMVWGEGYFVPEGAGVPDAATAQIREMFTSFPPHMRPARMTSAYMTLHKMFDGEVQGIFGLPFVVPTGSRCLWA